MMQGPLIGAADLACTAAEADAYFAMLGISMAPAQRDQLLRRTEGWMTGLRLAAMAAPPGPAAAEEILVDYPGRDDERRIGRQPASYPDNGGCFESTTRGLLRPIEIVDCRFGGRFDR